MVFLEWQSAVSVTISGESPHIHLFYSTQWSWARKKCLHLLEKLTNFGDGRITWKALKKVVEMWTKHFQYSFSIQRKSHTISVAYCELFCHDLFIISFELITMSFLQLNFLRLDQQVHYFQFKQSTMLGHLLANYRKIKEDESGLKSNFEDNEWTRSFDSAGIFTELTNELVLYQWTDMSSIF